MSETMRSDRPAALVERLREADVAVRVHAAIVLSELGSEARAAVPGLLAALRDEDAQVRRLAAWVLGYVGEGEEAKAALRRALRDPDEGTRRMALMALALQEGDAEQSQAA